MKKIVYIFLLLFVVVSCEKSSENLSVSSKANAFFEDAFSRQLDRSPISQAYLGIKKNEDQWDDLSEEHQKGDLDLSKQLLEELKQIDYTALDDATKLSYDLFKETLDVDIAAYQYRLHSYPVNQMFGEHSQVPSFLINIHQITSVQDAKNYIARVDKLPIHFDQLIKSLELRELKGIVPPKFVFPRVIESSHNVIKGYPITSDKDDKNPIYADFVTKVNKLEGVESTEKDALIKQLETSINTNLVQAYKRLIAFLEQQEKRATTDDGVWKLPEGEAFYKFALRRTTTTDMTPQQIFDFGKKEVARIHDEMRAIMKKVNFKGDLQDFFKFMQSDKQFYYPNTDEGRDAYLKKAVALIDNMKSRLDELFITKPKADMIVKRVEAFREKSAGTAFYNRPAPDGSRPGIYYANLYNMENMPKYQMEALAYHEGIPGHHMQIALAQELENTPSFRKYGGYTAYIEGWGLYTERIPKEMGLYSDPYSDFGRLAMELWRSCRLVADVGIHVKKWTREQAIAYYKENTPDTERDCVRMVERHIVMPSQATAYKIGMYKILTLRQHAKDKLGDKFDIREFHDVILTSGALPLNVLESLVNNYIAKKLGA